MKTVSPITEIFYCELNKADENIITDKYKRLLDEYNIAEGRLLAAIKDVPKTRRLYDELEEIHGKMDIENAEAYYKAGFCKGFMLVLEMLGRGTNERS